jgi:hypothetical protein
MRLCTDFNVFSVARAGNTSVNGFYYLISGQDTLGFSVFSFAFNNNAVVSYPRIQVYKPTPETFSWGIFIGPNQPAYKSSTNYTLSTNVPSCPNALTWVTGPGVTGTAPLVTGKTNAQIHNELVNAIYGNLPVNGFLLEDGSVSSLKLANSAVTESKIDNNAVSSLKLANSAVTESKIANNAVTEYKIANGAVTNAKLAGTISIDSQKITDGAITASKLSGALGSANVGSAPIYACRAWVNFDATVILNTPCTYVRNGIGNVKVTTTEGNEHNLLPGHIVYINFIDGGATDGSFLVRSVESPTVFNVNQTGSLISGTADIRSCSIRRNGNVSSIAYLGVGKYALNFSTPMPDVTYAVTFGGRARTGYVLSTEDEDGGNEQFQQTTNAFFFNITNSSWSRDDFSQVHCAVFR